MRRPRPNRSRVPPPAPAIGGGAAVGAACRAPAPDGAGRSPPRARTARTWRRCGSAGTADARAWCNAPLPAAAARGGADGLALRRQRRDRAAARPRAASAPAFICAGSRCAAAAPAHARRRRVAVHGQRGRDDLHGRRARGGRGVAAAPADTGWFCGTRGGRRAGRAPLRRPVAGLPRRPRARMALPHALRRADAADLRSRSRRPHAGRPLRRATTRASTAAAARTAGASRSGRRPPAGCKRTVRAAVAASAAAWRGAREADGHRRARARWPARARWRRCRRRWPAGGTSRRPPTACASTDRRRRSGSTRRFRSRPRSPAPTCAGAASPGSSSAVRARRDVADARRVRAHARACRRWLTSWAVRSRGASSRCRRARAARSCCARPGPTVAATRWRATRPRRRRPPLARPAQHARSASASTSAVRAGTSRRAPRTAPRRSTTAGGVASLLPDVAGDWRLADGGGRTLALRTARYDETPLDCGRSGCHAGDHRRRRGEPDDHACWRACWTPAARPADYPALRASPATRPASPARPTAASRTSRRAGRRGRSRSPLARPAARSAPAGRRRLPRLPRPGRDPGERRRAGACCAPTSAPSATTRPRATATSLAWRLTAMARADQNPRARGERACARCHTTWGFLDAGRDARTAARRPAPARRRRARSASAAPPATPCTIRKRPGARRLLRATPTPASAGGAGAASDSVCLPCHTPDAGDARPARLGGRPLARTRRAGSGDRRGADGRGAPRRGRGRLHRLPPRRHPTTSSAAPATVSARRLGLAPVPSAARRRRRTSARARSSCGARCARPPRRRARARGRRDGRASIAARRSAAPSGTCCSCWRIRRPARTTRATRRRCSTPPRRCIEASRQGRAR